MSFILLLILFNAFISAQYEGFNSELKSHAMYETKLMNLNLTANQNEAFQLFNGKENENISVYFLILVLGDAQIKVSSNEEKILNDTTEFKDILKIGYNTSDYRGKDININLISDKDVEIEITNIIQNKSIQYQNTEVNKDNTVAKNNFVFFLDDKGSTYNLEIKFNKDDIDLIEGKCHKLLLKLPVNDPNYILPISNYKGVEEVKNKNYEFEIVDNIVKDKRKNYTAFIFSVAYNNIHNYTVTISKVDKAMTIFLYVSIGLAGLFAVITFFLIRRKQSIDGKKDAAQEGLYNNEENKDEQ